MNTFYRNASRLPSRVATAACAVVALLFTAWGLHAITTLGLTELYADQWRQYLVYVSQPFPANVLVADNGHRTVFPSLIRVAELHWLDGNQLLQLASGALFAVATLIVTANLAWREHQANPAVRAAAVALMAFALFWLGNARMLLHGNEASHLYLIILCLVGALALVAPADAGIGRLLGACLLGVVATLSFGAGPAVFVAVAIVLLIQRRYRDMAVILAGLGVVLAAYVVVPGGDGVRNAIELRPIDNAHTSATWLASMWVTLLAPFTQVGAGGSLPAVLGPVAQALAAAYESTFGPVGRHHGPASIIGWVGVLSLFWMSGHSWRAGGAGPLRALGLGVAWFSLGVAGIVSLARLGYFAKLPEQIFANRYVPWSCLFWCGVLLAALSAPAVRAAAARRGMTAGVVGTIVALIFVLGILTTPGHRVWAGIVQNGVRLASAGFASGVVDADRSLGETVFAEVQSAIGPLRAARVSAFAWPEALRVGSTLTAAEPAAGIELVELRSTTVSNRLGGGSATRIEAQFKRTADVRMPERLSIVVRARAVGVLVRQASDRGWHYAGYADGIFAPEEVSLLRLRTDGSADCWAGCDASGTRIDTETDADAAAADTAAQSDDLEVGIGNGK